MKYSEVKRKLRKAKCEYAGPGTNHDWWYSPITNRRFQVPRHDSKEALPNTLKSISEQSGVKF